MIYNIELTASQISAIKALLVENATTSEGEESIKSWQIHQTISEQLSDQQPDNPPLSQRTYPQ